MQTLYIFDIDGVITNPYVKKPNPAILAFIADQLSQKKPVMLSTGRAIAWIEKNIVSALKILIKEEKDLDLLFISAEKGAVSAVYTRGILESTIDPKSIIPKEIRKAVIKKMGEYSGIFFDEDKQTMISIEIEGGTDMQKLEKQKESLAKCADWMNQNLSLDSKNIVIDSTEIAFDIQSKDINKKISAGDFLLFLHSKKITPTIFLVFGDSPSDIFIAEELFKKNYAVSFGYVGLKILTEKYPFPIFYPKDGKKFDEGVLDFLANK